MTYRKPYHDALDARRRLPGNCGRCGKPSPKRTCTRCRTYHRERKIRLRDEAQRTPDGVLSALAQFRRELSRLRATVKNMVHRYRHGYRHGYAAGQAGRRARFKRGIWMPPEMSRQELATINHAYELETS